MPSFSDWKYKQKVSFWFCFRLDQHKCDTEWAWMNFQEHAHFHISIFFYFCCCFYCCLLLAIAEAAIFGCLLIGYILNSSTSPGQSQEKVTVLTKYSSAWFQGVSPLDPSLWRIKVSSYPCPKGLLALTRGLGVPNRCCSDKEQESPAVPTSFQELFRTVFLKL